MRNVFVSMAMVFVSASAMAASEANHYSCKGRDLFVSMEKPTAEHRQATLFVSDSPQNDSVSPLENVKFSVVESGLQVEGLVPYLADANIAFTLLVPRVIVAAEPVKVKGMLIRTFTGGFIAPNPVMPRVIETNDYIPVKCDAQFIQVAP